MQTKHGELRRYVDILSKPHLFICTKHGTVASETEWINELTVNTGTREENETGPR